MKTLYFRRKFADSSLNVEIIIRFRLSKAVICAVLRLEIQKYGKLSIVDEAKSL